MTDTKKTHARRRGRLAGIALKVFALVALCGVGGGQSMVLRSSLATAAEMEDVVFVDFDGDGWQDLLLGSRSASYHVVVHRNWLGTGAGALSPFSTAIPLSAPPPPGAFSIPDKLSVAAGDLDNDGKQDVVVVSAYSNTFACNHFLQTFRNTTAGATPTFIAQTPVPLTFSAYAVQIADVLPSPGNEIILADYCNSLVRIFTYGAVIGPLASLAATLPSTGSLSQAPLQLATADMDGDGDIDIVVGSATIVTVFYNQAGSFIPYSVTAPADTSLVLGDIDGNGLLDIASCGTVGTVHVHLQVAQGSFFSVTVSPGGTRVALGDLNGDPFPDLVSINYTGAGQTTNLAFLNSGTPPYFAGPGVAVTSSNASMSGYSAAIESLGIAELDGIPGDDLVRIFDGAPQSDLEVWLNNTPQVGRPFPGTGGDARLLTLVTGPTAIPSIPGDPVKQVGSGDTITLSLNSPGGTLIGAPAIIAAQAFTTGVIPTPSALSLGLHFNFAQPLFFVHNSFDPAPVPGLGNGSLPWAGLHYGFGVPASGPPAGASLLVQCLVVTSTGAFVTTDGHELRF